MFIYVNDMNLVCKKCGNSYDNLSALGGHARACGVDFSVYSIKRIPENKFLKNKYTDLYFKLLFVDYSKHEQTYFEKHHVIPKSLGGVDTKDNMVKIPSRVHFICHYLLTKMTEGSDLIKMMHAFGYMKYGHSGKRYYNSRLYSHFQKQQSIIMSAKIGEENSQYGSCWIYNKELKVSKKIHKITVLEKGWLYGRYDQHSETKSKLREAALNERGELRERENLQKEKIFRSMFVDFSKGEYSSVDEYKRANGITFTSNTLRRNWKKIFLNFKYHSSQGSPLSSIIARKIIN